MCRKYSTATLSCEGNDLNSLDDSKNMALTRLECINYFLSNLDVSKSVSLFFNCSPMPSLETLCLSSGQSIEGVTVNRSTDNEPDNTSIVIK